VPSTFVSLCLRTGRLAELDQRVRERGIPKIVKTIPAAPVTVDGVEYPDTAALAAAYGVSVGYVEHLVAKKNLGAMRFIARV